MEELKQISHADDLQLLQMAIQLPDALQSEREELDDSEWEQIEKAISEAISDIKSYRTEEGAALEKILSTGLELIQEAGSS